MRESFWQSPRKRQVFPFEWGPWPAALIGINEGCIEYLVLPAPGGRAQTTETRTTAESFLRKKGHKVF